MKVQQFNLVGKSGTEFLVLPDNSDIFAVMQDGDNLALFATVEDGYNDGDGRTFVIVKTGDEMPTDLLGEKLYLGSVSFVHAFQENGVGIVRDTPFELHVWEVAPPLCQGRPRLDYPGKGLVIMNGDAQLFVDEVLLSDKGKKAVLDILRENPGIIRALGLS